MTRTIFLKPRRRNAPSVVFYMLLCVTASAFRTFVVHRALPRSVPPQRFFASVTGTVYLAEPTTHQHGEEEAGAASAPAVTLFTKEGCTLCDKVKEVLFGLRTESPHSLIQRDITDDPDLYERYKYDIPVLHVDGQYWAKHRLTADEALEGLRRAREKTFHSPPGEPNAGKLERQR